MTGAADRVIPEAANAGRALTARLEVEAANMRSNRLPGSKYTHTNTPWRKNTPLRRKGSPGPARSTLLYEDA